MCIKSKTWKSFWDYVTASTTDRSRVSFEKLRSFREESTKTSFFPIKRYPPQTHYRMFNLHFPFVIAVYFRPFHTTLNIKVFVFIFHVPFGLTLSGKRVEDFFSTKVEKVKGKSVWERWKRGKFNELAAFNELNAFFRVSTGIIYYLNGWQSR